MIVGITLEVGVYQIGDNRHSFFEYGWGAGAEASLGYNNFLIRGKQNTPSDILRGQGGGVDISLPLISYAKAMPTKGWQAIPTGEFEIDKVGYGIGAGIGGSCNWGAITSSRVLFDSNF